MANIDQVQLPDGSQYHIIDDTSGYATTTYVQDQIATINKNTIGLGNVDNTADINKPVSLPQQDALNGKVDDDIVAYVEGDTTATKRHEVDDQFILNGVLYTATAIIAVNDTIVIGTNCDSAESVATQITENANAIVSLRSDITSINQTGTTATQTIPSGTYFYLNGVLVRAKTAIASGATFTLNTNYEVVTVGDELNGKIAKVNRLTYTVTTTALANAIGGNEGQFNISDMTGYSPAIEARTIAHNVISTFCTGDARYLAVVSIASGGTVIVNASLPANYEIVIEQIYI
jgi:hypothetical protein